MQTHTYFNLFICLFTFSNNKGDNKELTASKVVKRGGKSSDVQVTAT